RIFRSVRHLEPASIRLRLVHADPDVVKLLVRKQKSIVTVVALDPLKNIPTTKRTLANRRLIACAPAIPRRITSDDCPLKRSNRLHQVLRRRVALKYFLKLRSVTLQGIYFRDDFGSPVSDTHVRARPCSHRLLLERIAATVPVKLCVITDIPKRRAVTRQSFVLSADRCLGAVR